jgi:hypothetical protein
MLAREAQIATAPEKAVRSYGENGESFSHSYPR